MSRTVGQKLSAFLDQLIPVLTKFLDSLNSSHSIDIDNEIVESTLGCLESLVKRCPKEVKPYVEKILTVCLSLITYDPNYAYGDDDEVMEEDEGEGWGSDMDDGDMA